MPEEQFNKEDEDQGRAEPSLSGEGDSDAGPIFDGGAADGSGEKRLQNEISEWKDKYVRLLAEFDNFKKRVTKERSELLKYQGDRIFVDLLDVIDNFELSQQYAEQDPAQYRSGIELIFKKFQDFLQKWEVKGASSIGRQFDPTIHNAISKAPAGSNAPGSIVGELKKPYFYKDKLLRPGEVVVAAEEEGDLLKVN
jgi:molecular chaperone GrpE